MSILSHVSHGTFANETTHGRATGSDESRWVIPVRDGLSPWGIPPTDWAGSPCQFSQSWALRAGDLWGRRLHVTQFACKLFSRGGQARWLHYKTNCSLTHYIHRSGHALTQSTCDGMGRAICHKKSYTIRWKFVKICSLHFRK